MKKFEKFLLGTVIVAGVAAITTAIVRECHLIEKLAAKKKELEAKAAEEDSAEEGVTEETDAEEPAAESEAAE